MFSGVFVGDTCYVSYSDQSLMDCHSLILEWADARKRARCTLHGFAVPEIIINDAYWRRKKCELPLRTDFCARSV